MTRNDSVEVCIMYMKIDSVEYIYVCVNMMIDDTVRDFHGFLLVALTWNAEDLIPPSERFIFNFNSKEELKKWHLYSDSEYGGVCLLNFDVLLHAF